jgi:hypothetical protein
MCGYESSSCEGQRGRPGIAHRYKRPGTNIEGTNNTRMEPVLMSALSDNQEAAIRANDEKHQ